MVDGNVRFFMKRKGQLLEDNLAFHPFISHNTVKNVTVHPSFKINKALFCFSLTIDENTDIVHLIEGFVFK